MSLSWTVPGSRPSTPSGLLAAGAAVCLLAGCAAASGGSGTAGPPSAAPDWRAATYRVTCDGIVPDGIPVTLTDGAAQVPADGSRPPFYDHYEVRWEADARGDVDGDGEPDTVVLLQCSPQPSNGIVEEVQVFTASGDRLGLLPSPRTLREGTPLPPLYDPAGLSVRDGDVVAAMRAYAPGDSHASGPSLPLTVRWHWDGQDFVRVP
ncbi:hypothetical protein SAMN05660690_0792 [Geodermatophilus telluris]|uniref:Lipoprotein n=1 Tax=Geodermatophilus telluris TaxID=1190417 RepID=A0A1G6JEC9_9ACTN|nr:hypothetical protein [Geodermatophilus telluris]SDC17098.1 hypothetical protein SAMN05660690_0792 [Geodermatophilus telluris]